MSEMKEPNEGRRTGPHPRIPHRSHDRGTKRGWPQFRRSAQADTDEDRYRSLFENAHIGVYRTTPEGRILMANPALIAMLGCASFEELAARNLEAEGFQPTYDRAAFKQTIEQTGEIRGLEQTWRRRDGPLLFVRENARVVRDAAGRVQYYEGTVEDITERRQAEHRVVHLNAVLRAIRNVNQLVVQEKEVAGLLERVCDILIEPRGYASAWVVLLDENDEKSVRAWAKAGPGPDLAALVKQIETGDLPKCIREALSVPTPDTASSSSIVHRSLPEPIVVQDPARDCPSCPRHLALPGWRTMVARLAHGDRMFGVLSVALPTEVLLDAEERGLFAELALDLGYVLHTPQVAAERTAAGIALRESEERFRVTFEQAAAGIARIAPDGHFIRVNRRFCEITGYSEQELLALNYSDITSPDDARTEQESIVRLLAGEVNSYTMEKRYIRKDASSVWVNLTVSVVRHETGEPDYLIAVTEDITEGHRARQELQNLVENLKALNQLAVELAAAPPEVDLYRFLGEHLARITDAVMIAVSQYDPAERALVVRYVRIPGGDLIAEAGRLLGADPAAFRTPVNDETYRWLLTTTVRDVDSLHESTFGAVPEPASLASHTLLGVGCVLGVTIADQGELVGSAVIGRRKGAPGLNPEIMLTFATMAAVSLRHKRAEEQVQTLNTDLARRITELESAVKELDAFSYSISHDLRSPLRAIDGFSRILIEDYQAALPAPARAHLDRIRQSTQHMSKLIDDLLAFSRLSRQPLRLQPVQPAPLVRRVLDDLHEDQRGRNVKITIQDLPACRGDAAMLQQVFHNLLANALKFTRPRDPALIEIGSMAETRQPTTSDAQHATPVPLQVTYFIRDNGVGFDDQYADRAFGVFQRLHHAEEYEGTGVGLAIVQHIIHRHGGQVWAKAQVDEGATFYFTLPADAESNPA